GSTRTLIEHDVVHRRAMSRIALIGARPSALPAARAPQQRGIHVDRFEPSPGVGGPWDLGDPRTTKDESAHLISSRTTTEFTEFPMASTADYPGHRVLKAYFDDYADAFGLRELFRFDTRITRVDPSPEGGWSVQGDGLQPQRYDGVILANGTLAEPNAPAFPGEFAGEIMHTSRYKSAEQLRGRRVLIIG